MNEEQDNDRGMHVYAGLMFPVKDGTNFPHRDDKYYFGPKTHTSPVPFSRAYDSFDAAEAGMKDYLARTRW